MPSAPERSLRNLVSVVTGAGSGIGNAISLRLPDMLTNAVHKLRNVLRGLLQQHSLANIKKRMWDREFASGRWDCLDNMAEDCLYPYVERFANGGTILDLGCGPGATGNELNANSYRRYTGVDISEVALDKARARTEQNYRGGKNQYFPGDIYAYVPEGLYDVIVFGDSIYYVAPKRIPRMLDRYSNHLSDGGVFIVRIRGARLGILNMIESRFQVVEKHLHYTDVHVLVFRPAARPN